MAKEELLIIKIGGNVIDRETALRKFLKDLCQLNKKFILVHGGGKLATALAGKLGIEQEMINGRRITNAETLKIATMVYAGWVNKSIVSCLQASNCNALGFTGADAGLIHSKKRVVKDIDYGFVGDVVAVNGKGIHDFLAMGITPVFCAITATAEGQLLNTNADTVAAAIAIAMSQFYTTELVYCFEKSGILVDPENEQTLLPVVDTMLYKELIEQGTISGGMIPKTETAFEALINGVSKVQILHADQLKQMKNEKIGTSLVL